MRITAFLASVVQRPVSGIVTLAPVSSVPASVRTSPFGRVVLVGYQRPAAMAGSTCHTPATGSNTLVLARPCRSEERRVGKECGGGWGGDHESKNVRVECRVTVLLVRSEREVL